MSAAGATKAVLAKLALLAGSLLLALVVAEQVLRALDFEYRPMSIEIGDRGDARQAHLFDDKHFVYDPELIWRPRADLETFNRQGYRGPEVVGQKPPGLVRVVAVGDSNTLGWAGVTGANWPGELAALLAARQAGRYQVINAGVWGYTSHQGLARLREALELEPDLVLVSFGSNDAHLVTRTDREYSERTLDSERWRALLDYRLGQLAIQFWDRAGGGGGTLRHRVPLDEYRENLRAMAAEARAAGAEPLFLTRPYVGPIRDDGWWKNFGEVYNLATIEVAEEVEAPVADLFTLFKDQSELFRDESHFTREGHRLAATIVLEHLEPLLPPDAAGTPSTAGD